MWMFGVKKKGGGGGGVDLYEKAQLGGGGVYCSISVRVHEDSLMDIYADRCCSSVCSEVESYTVPHF